MHIVKKNKIKINLMLITFFVVWVVGAAEDFEEANGNANGKCVFGRATTTTLIKLAYGLTNNGTFH